MGRPAVPSINTIVQDLLAAVVCRCLGRRPEHCLSMHTFTPTYNPHRWTNMVPAVRWLAGVACLHDTLTWITSAMGEDGKVEALEDCEIDAAVGAIDADDQTLQAIQECLSAESAPDAASNSKRLAGCRQLMSRPTFRSQCLVHLFCMTACEEQFFTLVGLTAGTSDFKCAKLTCKWSNPPGCRRRRSRCRARAARRSVRNQGSTCRSRSRSKLSTWPSRHTKVSWICRRL